jgi:hypothetical protein
MSTHRGQHEDCYGCKLATVQFGNVEAPPQRKIEDQWSKDLPAYARLRKEGKRPPHTIGAAELEARANTDREVNMGRLIHPSAWSQVGNAIVDAEHAAKAAVQANTDVAKQLGESLRGGQT